MVANFAVFREPRWPMKAAPNHPPARLESPTKKRQLMNPTRTTLGLFALLGSACFGEPEFVGVFSTPNGTSVALRLETTDAVWVAFGHSTGGYTLSAYDSRRETVLLKRADGSALELRLKTASVKPAPTLQMFAPLKDSGDQRMKRLYLQALMLDANRKTIAAEIARAIKEGGGENSELLINLRKQLSEVEGKLAQQLSSLMNAVESAPKDAGDEKTPAHTPAQTQTGRGGSA